MLSWTTPRRRVREGRRRRTGGKTTGTGAGAIGREERITTECLIITLLYHITLSYEIVVVMRILQSKGGYWDIFSVEYVAF